ncbi:MAG: CO dehydrogenase/CO-methylating acetyl-CoA synthase complex, beta subunit [Candidatus Bathyarchaeota archaeon B24]|nr:MAG: CO dehydrogenase/CO-methylating acetyl-CoA synthase complex, beta subunit [Candidatus Bathyarchaeota archaeon B24]
MFQDIPVDVGIAYEGERIRRPQMYLEFGGPKVKYKFELARVRKPEEVEDGKVKIVGPDIKDLPEGSSVPLGILVEVAGSQLEEDLEGIIERRIHEFTNYINGFMHLNQRYDIWCRLSKEAFKKGLNSFTYIGKVMIRLYKADLPIIEKIQVTFITDPKEVERMYHEALKIYEARDARARGLRDEDVEEFYGCTLCQSFAPTHVCVITPQRYANCGAISWFDGRAASKVDPKGPIFRIPKGECLDPFKGEYSGVNKVVQEKSLGAIKRVWLYTAFGYPHTSCGCFEAIAFYIPEVDGFGIVHRDFKGPAINGLPFSTMADATGGGRQVDGFHGISIEYMRSPKFLQVDGGWRRVVWVPKAVYERVKDFIPEDVRDKIATDEDVKTIEELIEFLKAKGHPVVERWKEKEAEKAEAKPVEAEAVAAAPEAVPQITGMTGVSISGIPMAAGGLRIILKGAKIRIDKVVIKRTGSGGK